MSRIAIAVICLGLLAEPAGATIAGGVAGTPADAAVSRPESQDVVTRLAGALASFQSDRGSLSEPDINAVKAFYAARDHRPVWIWEKGLNTRGLRVLGQLATAAEDGLQASDYLPASLVSFADEAVGFADNLAALARLELEVTRAALTYARHASGGRLNPAEVDRNMAIVPETVEAGVALAALAGTVRPDRYLASLLPRGDDYIVLKAALAAQRARIARASHERVPDGPLIRPGDDNDRIPVIRRRLIELGQHALKVTENGENRGSDRPTAEAALVSSRYDAPLENALREFQRSRGLLADGIVGPSTVAALNGPGKAELNTILINMERLRWLPRDLGRRHIMVNQAAFRLRLYDDLEIVHSARVIVGKRRNQTPVLADEMERIVFNPYWNVPRSIATKEMLPRLAEDPHFLARQGYEVFWNDGRSTQRIDSSDVDWWQVDRQSFNFTFRQPPGRSNALGKLKFLFPNRYNIYLHDTPSKSLFNRTSRAFSHGCVRLQHPEKLAEILLGWDKGWSPSKIARMIRAGRSQAVELDRRIPVYLTYLTAWMGDDGKFELLPDVYGRDPAMTRALGQFPVAMK